MKENRRMMIYQISLQLNATSDALPYKSGGAVDNAEKSVLVRFNARQLYRLYLKNSASWEDAHCTFEQWCNGGCVVALSSDDISGICPSPSIRGQVTLTGEVFFQNNMGFPACVADTRQAAAIFAGAYVEDNHQNGDDEETSGMHNERMTHYEGCVIAYYTNKAMVVDAKSAMITEAVYSAQLGEQLRLNPRSVMQG
jgi:hypothetical protein